MPETSVTSSATNSFAEPVLQTLKNFYKHNVRLLLVLQPRCHFQLLVN